MRHRLTLILLCTAIAPVSAQTARARTIALPPAVATLPVEFTMVSSVRELADGRVLVVDQQESKLVVTDWKTGTAMQVGRSGSGPAEYKTPNALIPLAGDSTLLPDMANGRWLLLHGASMAVTIAQDAPAIAAGARRPLGADSMGRVIFTKGLGIPGGPSSIAAPGSDSLLLLRTARSTGKTDTVAILRARDSFIKIEGPKEKPTSIEIRVHPLAAGELAALFEDGWIAVARLEPYRVDWISADGRQIRGQPLPFERIPLDDAEQRAYVERVAARSGGPAPEPSRYGTWPEIMPPFRSGALLAAPDGRLWIQRVATAAAPYPPYDVVDRRGALVARVIVDGDVKVVGFGRGVVYTVATDEDGIQRLQKRPMPDA